MMTNQATRRARRHNLGLRGVVGVLLCAGFAAQCHRVASAPAGDVLPVSVEIVPTAALATASWSDTDRLAHDRPLNFFKYCLEHYRQNVKDYKVTFIKQEMVREKLTAEQVTEVRFRESPYSVDMTWTRNPGRAARVLYVKGLRTDKDGDELALVKPSGFFGGLGVKVWSEIHGRDAKREARRTIDQFGFKNSLELIIEYCEKAQAEGALKLQYVGDGSIDGRPTYVFERRLPYTGEEGPYPDRYLIIHIDKQWLAPTGCFAYADDEGERLLGRYVLTDAQFNVGYTPSDFDPNTIQF